MLFRGLSSFPSSFFQKRKTKDVFEERAGEEAKRWFLEGVMTWLCVFLRFVQYKEDASISGQLYQTVGRLRTWQE